MSRAKLNRNGNPYKVVDREISNDAMDTIANLTKTGIKILNYLMSNCVKDEGKIYVDKEIVMFDCELKEKSFFNGIKDLISNDIIAVSDQSYEYYFNHAYFGEKLEQ